MDNQTLSRYNQLNENIPLLFDELQNRKTLLYVGASVNRCQFLPQLFDVGYIIDILEPHKPNADHYRGDIRIRNVYQTTIQNIDSLSAYYDIIFWWHGLEHIERNEASQVLADIEACCDLVILGMPYGRYEQGDFGGNPYEKHVSHWYPADLRELGYNVSTIGEVDTPNTSNMVAWKETR